MITNQPLFYFKYRVETSKGYEEKQGEIRADECSVVVDSIIREVRNRKVILKSILVTKNKSKIL